jgi:hypothetical protein
VPVPTCSFESPEKIILRPALCIRRGGRGSWWCWWLPVPLIPSELHVFGFGVNDPADLCHCLLQLLKVALVSHKGTGRPQLGCHCMRTRCELTLDRQDSTHPSFRQRHGTESNRRIDRESLDSRFYLCRIYSAFLLLC